MASLAKISTGDGSCIALKQQWAQLIKQVYEADPLLCPQCGGPMRIIAFIEQRAVIEKILTHLGLWPPQAHGPPSGACSTPGQGGLPQATAFSQTHRGPCASPAIANSYHPNFYHHHPSPGPTSASSSLAPGTYRAPPRDPPSHRQVPTRPRWTARREWHKETEAPTSPITYTTQVAGRSILTIQEIGIGRNSRSTQSC